MVLTIAELMMISMCTQLIPRLRLYLSGKSQVSMLKLLLYISNSAQNHPNHIVTASTDLTEAISQIGDYTVYHPRLNERLYSWTYFEI